jgi:hypothetical protein
MPLPDGQGCTNPFLEESLVWLDPVRGEDADIDLRPRVMESRAQKPLAMVFDLHELAIGGGLREPEHGAMIDPRMAGQDTIGFARLQQDCWQ